MSLALVALGGAIGAPTRYFVDRIIQRRRALVFPWGTFCVNVAGCLMLGVLVGAGVGDSAFALVGVGFCGALTTYSTFGYETYRLLEQRSFLLATANVLGSLAATMAAVGLGYLAGTAVV
ncbi:MAG: fluoride efflux transporter CrcB [Demequinaceae bacterium]|nr:fluoride efflux transporter CrcB [Demequinaceae bacterium]